MDKRRKIGIVFANDESWAGGFYYALNIIRSLNYLSDKYKPAITVFTRDSKHHQTIEEIRYPYLDFLPLFPPLPKVLNWFNKITGRKFFTPRIYKKNIVEFVYPINYYGSYESLKNLKNIYWVPDFQHLHYPENFTPEVIKFREQRIHNIIQNQFDIVFSSMDSKKDFTNKYSDAPNKLHVLNFPSVLPAIKKEYINRTLLKYKITKNYFLCSNQFWKHKNHMKILEAIKNLKNHVSDLQVIFTGNMVDHCEKNYVNSLLQFTKANNINSNVCFLGYIDRMDQLNLIKGSVAVIQPSLFEGWSTIVEDCKALNHFVVLSDINVHKEQIKTNCLFFRANDSKDLAEKMEQAIQFNPAINENDYAENILTFAKRIIDLRQ